MSQLKVKGEQRLGLEECPVSYISGESAAAVDDVLAHLVLGGGRNLLEWPARRVDAFATLWSEMRKVENNQRAE